MPLPFAPKPAESRVYQSLKDELLTELTADQFDSLRQSVYAQGIEGAEDEYRRIILLGLASNQVSVSGPFPGSGAINAVEITSNTDTNVLEPDVGESWEVTAMSTGTMGSGTANIRIGWSTDSNSVEVDTTTNEGVPFPGDDLSVMPIRVTYPQFLFIRSTSVSGTMQIYTAYHRVR